MREGFARQIRDFSYKPDRSRPDEALDNFASEYTVIYEPVEKEALIKEEHEEAGDTQLEKAELIGTYKR